MAYSKKKKWTVMVYLAGDNDLNDDMNATLRSLHALRGNPGCNIFAYYATTNLPREAVLYDFRKETDVPLEACERPNLGHVHASTLGNSAKMKTLVDFVRGCRQVVRTEHNVLIISAHSDAFLGRSLVQDETSLKVMSFFELHKALRDITGVLGDNKLDILGFDSCAMGLVEVAYQLRDCASVLVTPQDFTPSSGWNYEEMLHSLVKDDCPDEDPVMHAKCFVKGYVCVQRDFTVGGRSVEIAACHLDSVKFGALLQKIKRLADLLRVELPHVPVPSPPTEDGAYGDDTVDNSAPGIIYSRLVDLILCSHWFAQTHMQDQTVDVCHFCINLILQCQKLIKHIDEIRGACQIQEDVDKLYKKLEKIRDLAIDIFVIMRGTNEQTGIVIASSHSGNQHQSSFGLSLFFPWSRLAFVLSFKTYKRLLFTRRQGKSWLSLVNRFTVETMRQDPEDFIVVGQPPFLPPQKYNPPGKGALASFREKFGKVKNYPMEDLDEPDCDKPDCD